MSYPGGLICGRRECVKNIDAAIGYCHNMSHRGKITVRIMKEHDCLGKHCPYFELFSNKPYWKSLEKKKEKRRARREEKQSREAALKEMELCIREIAEELAPDMEITSVRKIGDRYNVFYVSDSLPKKNEQEHAPFREAVYAVYPERLMSFRHIKNESGRFVTPDEYHAVRR